MNQCQICDQGRLQLLKGDFFDYLSEERFEIWFCDDCGCMQTKGNVTGDYYGQAYYGSPEGKFSPLIEAIFTANHKRNAHKFFQAYKPKTVLEIGCGRAYMLSALQNLGCQVQGLESAHAAEWILNNPYVLVHGVRDGETWPIEDNSIDLVIMWHVLEHVSNPKAVLSEIRRVLSKQGTLCISVPNIESIQAQASLARWFHLDVPRHLFHFSHTGLIRLLQNQGYVIKQTTEGDITQNLYGWWQTLANMITPKHNNVLYRFLQGGTPWESCTYKHYLIGQVLGLPLIIPLGICAWIWESLTDRPGTMTIHAQQIDS